MSDGLAWRIMRVMSSSPLIVFLIVLSIVSVPFCDIGQNPELSNEATKMEQIGGGGGSLEEQCGSITFENMFEYSRATFDIIIDDDWESANVKAVAWVNNTLADELRLTMDEFMELLDPNKGGDGWFSTDEREFFRALASECIEHTLTRIGLRDGPAHRGGLGTDWKNTSWEEDGVVIEEWNIVPPRHSQIRGCTSSIGGDCNEVPVIPDSSRDCDTSVSQDLDVDECRVQLWLNATLSITGVDDPSRFTFSLNASNLSGARFDFTFPQMQDLRLEMWDECEGRDVGLNESTAGGQAPTVGGCVGDGSSTFNLVSDDDGRLTLELSPNGYREDWPMGEDLFFDFTTEPIPEPAPPVWTEESPPNGTWFPVPNSGDVSWANWDEGVSRWFYDEGGVSNLEIVCVGEQDLNFGEALDRSLMASVPDSGMIEVTCAARDVDGEMTENRTWYIGVPFSLYSESDILTDPHQITIDVNPGWPPLSVSVHLIQGASSQELGVMEIVSSGATSIQGSSSNMQPGFVDVRVLVSGDGVFDMKNTYLLGLVKESSPPLISISDSIWDGSKWSMQGQYSDPDGESVSFTMRVDGATAGSVSVSGNSWSTPLIDFSLWDSGEHTVEVEGCDVSFKCTVVYQVVNNSILFEVDEPDCEALTCGCDPSLCDEDEGIGGLLPANGIISVILSFALGTVFYRRRG
mgnify:CR=1 FL=1|tara:strand:- start:2138 stop:4207 length:2070 start_codon:yes stop_codon:yes gene_type:complete